MKTNVNLLVAMALMATACTTGSKVTSGGYADDLYYTPGDAQPVRSKPKVEKEEVKQPQQKSMVMMQVEENEQGKVVNNYVVPKSSRKDKNAYYFEDQPAYSDTTLEYKDNKEHITINNYFEGEEMSYSTRIRTFYDPFFYDPFWDPYWGHFYSPFSYGWGWGGWYDPFYLGYGYGWGGYYPHWGWGGFSPYWGWGGYYSAWGWGGYYPGWGWGGYFPMYDVSIAWSNRGYYAGIQNYTGKRGGSNAVRYGMNTNKNGVLQGLNTFTGRNPNAAATRLSSANATNGTVNGTRSAAGGTGATGTRLSNARDIREINTSQQGNANAPGTRIGRGETISNLRRSNANMQSNGIINQNNTATRSAAAGRDYTPTYNRPRMNTQPSYSSGSTRQYNAPQSTYGNNTQTHRFDRPQGSGGGYGGGAVRSQSSGGYQRGSANSSTTRSYNGNNYNNSRSYTPSYGQSSAPSRSYSAPSGEGGSRGSFGGGSGNSGGGNSGGGGTRSSSGRTR